MISRLRTAWIGWRSARRLMSMARQVAAQATPSDGKRPVAFFNASARITGLSLNAAFSLLAAWSLRLAGVPVAHFVCRSGMSRCVLGSNRDDHTAPPPCESCIETSRRLYHQANPHWFSYVPDDTLTRTIQRLSVDQLMDFVYQSRPLGALALPSLRWTLRRHTLLDDVPTRHLLREYILSANRVMDEFDAFLAQVNPSAAVIFNGTMFPEAAARWVAQRRGVRVITHEVAFEPFSAFFTGGEATAYPVDIPEDFELSPAQDERLNVHLAQRFQGEFTMAGIRFWPQMQGLDEDFLARAAQFKQIVPIFTNVVFDTSQVHANTVFPHMFAWLDTALEIIHAHPETLFVIRAHPDEMRPGTGKQSRESVRQWVEGQGVSDLPNVAFIDSEEYVSSYELIQQAKFVIVYNSSIGLEATLLGRPVLCGGQARYTQYPTVFFPQTPDSYRQQAEEFLTAEAIPLPEEFVRNARRFLYFQLFRTSLPLGEFVENHPRPGFIQLRPFDLAQLRPEHSMSLKVIQEGILEGGPFLANEDS